MVIPTRGSASRRSVRSSVLSDQVTSLLESVQALLGQALVGVYLHGSLAYGCFNPDRSDLDLLALSER
ncbi:MAG: nucleotidyltransferase domain-containing protein, partial [Actinobacteria bacterium]|nr:nucleotidyltransferase domain-containing protein [Actinomycetota bacterium]